MHKQKRLIDAYRFKGFEPSDEVTGIFGDPKARVIRLNRCKKTVCPICGRSHNGFYDRKIRRVRDLSCGDTRIYLDLEIRRVQCRSCQKVTQERLPFLAENPFYTKRFAFYVGKCYIMFIWRTAG